MIIKEIINEIESLYINRFIDYDDKRDRIKALEDQLKESDVEFTPKIMVKDILYVAMDPAYWTIRCIEESIIKVRIMQEKRTVNNHASFYPNDKQDDVEETIYKIDCFEEFDEMSWVKKERLFHTKEEAMKGGFKLIERYVDGLVGKKEKLDNEIEKHKGYLK